MTITAYLHGCPNGYKVTILLELLKMKYDLKSVNVFIPHKEKEPWFLKLNPNGKIPVLIDDSTNTTISESGAIMMYLADTYDKERKFSYEVGTKEYYKQLELTMFQMSAIGPLQGQANHFIKSAKIDYGITRYTNETKRLYGVVEEHLKRNEGSDYLVGSHVSIADISIFVWALFLPWIDIKLSEFPRVEKWVKNMLTIPEIMEGLQHPGPSGAVPKELGGKA